MAVLVEESGVEGVVVEEKEMHGRRGSSAAYRRPYIPITELCNSMTYSGVFHFASGAYDACV
jgi:hypothetical protein